MDFLEHIIPGGRYLFNIFSKEGIIQFLFVLPALLISLSVHELAHAYSAYKLGDKSQKYLGRLTLDPFAHIDWMGFLCIALLGFGWGKPVVVDDRNFKNRARDNMLVALAGPASNLLMAVVFTIILKLLLVTGLVSVGANSQVSSVIITMFTLAIQFNAVFAIFNMLPIPPFDGSKVLFYFLPYKWKDIMFTLQRYSFVIIIVFLVTGLGSIIVSPIVNVILNILNVILML
ncbi:MAG: site-2 protease family protein [Clostridia bacterium]